MSLLLDEEGNLRSFPEFRKAVKKVNIQWNDEWLRTEYNTAVRSARSAANYRDALRTKEMYPNLEYLKSTSSEKREEHLEWVGTVLPIDHPWWDSHLPPVEWNCKCSFRPTDKPATDVPASSGVEIPPVFRNNPGKTGEFVKLSEHPYLKGKGDPNCPECRRQGLASGKVDNADAFIDRGSKYCIAHRFVYLANLKSFAQKAIETLKTHKRHEGGSVIIGQLDNSIRKNIQEERGIKLYRTDATTNAHTIYKYINHTKQTKGAVLPFDEIDYLLKAVLDPDKVYLQTEGKGRGCYIMTTPYRDGKVVKVLVHVNYHEKRRVYNNIKSWGIVDEMRMDDPIYLRIK